MIQPAQVPRRGNVRKDFLARGRFLGGRQLVCWEKKLDEIASNLGGVAG